MPRVLESEQVRSEINVTPLVDVVLVLLIIFMIIAPQLHTDAAVQLPETERPEARPDDGRRIVVLIDADGRLWIDGDETDPQRFPDRIRESARGREDWKVVIQGDARLQFGEVQRAMLAIEAAGFENVGLIAERRDDLAVER